ncbi:hypothetical protein LXA43DRAFT_1021116 [Ganoderma leucocontextum]|nr:hypothetical protein LXA43DRAFT_1021116 [Ganoderma leucocontextum]
MFSLILHSVVVRAIGVWSNPLYNVYRISIKKVHYRHPKMPLPPRNGHISGMYCVPLGINKIFLSGTVNHLPLSV